MRSTWGFPEHGTKYYRGQSSERPFGPSILTVLREETSVNLFELRAYARINWRAK